MISSFTIGSLLLGLALVLVVLLFLTRPFLQPIDPDFEEEEQIESLLAQKDALMQDLRSLDSDMEAGKVAPELYAHDRPLLLKRAALTLQQLDQLGYNEFADAPVAMSVDDQIEAAVRKLRTPAEVDADIEAAVQQMRQKATAAPAKAPAQPAPAAKTTIPVTRFCPQCGQPVDPDDRFCSSCGYSLTTEPQPIQSV
ncbi:MAG: zinc ribbon domain-containing protein [Chloroflexota bacterium]